MTSDHSDDMAGDDAGPLALSAAVAWLLLDGRVREVRGNGGQSARLTTTVLPGLQPLPVVGGITQPLPAEAEPGDRVRWVVRSGQVLSVEVLPPRPEEDL